jgi:hypothetical protein
MPALSYHKQFAPLVESGAKLQTIRAMRKVPVKPGDTLYHFTGMRTKACRRLGVSICTEALQIDILTGKYNAVCLQMCLGGSQRRIGKTEILAIAKADGFDSIDAFYAWFGNPGESLYHLHGQLIKWTAINPF